MITPIAQHVMSCPCCHGTIRTTATYCPHCHAEKHFGPLRRETLLYSCLGFLFAPIIASLVLPASYWSGVIALGGMGIGFAFAQYRFNTDRWIRS